MSIILSVILQKNILTLICEGTRQQPEFVFSWLSAIIADIAECSGLGDGELHSDLILFIGIRTPELFVLVANILEGVYWFRQLEG